MPTGIIKKSSIVKGIAESQTHIHGVEIICNCNRLISQPKCFKLRVTRLYTAGMVVKGTVGANRQMCLLPNDKYKMKKRGQQKLALALSGNSNPTN